MLGPCWARIFYVELNITRGSASGHNHATQSYRAWGSLKGFGAICPCPHHRGICPFSHSLGRWHGTKPPNILWEAAGPWCKNTGKKLFSQWFRFDPKFSVRPGLSNPPQSRHVYFGVNLRSLDGTVPKDGRDFLQWSPLPQQGGCRGVTKHMGRAAALTPDSRPAHRPSDDDRNGRMGSESTKRSTSADKQYIAIGSRPAALQVGHNCISNLLGQRQPSLTTPFSRYVDPGSFPVDIPQMKPDDIVGPQSQTREEK